MNWYPKYVQGEPVYIKDSGIPYEISFWNGDKQKYHILRLDENGMILDEKMEEEDILEPIRLAEYYKYIFNFNKDQLGFLKRIFEESLDKETIIVDGSKLEMMDRIALDGILRKINVRKESKHGQRSADQRQFDMLHDFYKIDEENTDIISFSCDRVKNVFLYMAK